MMYLYAEFVKSKFELLKSLVDKHKVLIYAEELSILNTDEYQSILPIISRDINTIELSMLSFTDNINGLVIAHREQK